MREGYRGTDLKHGQGEKTGSITADLNTHDHDLGRSSHLWNFQVSIFVPIKHS